MLPDSFIQELKDRTDIESLIGGYVAIKRKGRNLNGLCPFHSEKTPSFTVYPESQSFYCFGCGAGGDIVSFVRRIENLEYMEAIKLLAQRAGLELPEDRGDDGAARLKTRILELNRETARFFHQQLITPPGAAALDYLHNRGLKDGIIRKFGVGYAPNDWTQLLHHLQSKGYSQEEMVAAAVITKGRNASYYDAFRHRVMFPIIDLRGGVIAFGGRALDDKGPKYLNSGDTPVFKKSRNLFALNVAKATKRTQLLLCEGYMDVISVHQGGFDNAVATLGTSLTPEQARILSQYTTEVIIAYDSDAAGQAAAKRAINLFDQTGLKVKVLSLTGAKDPDEFIKKYGPTRFDMLLDGSAGAVQYSIGQIKGKYDTDTSEGKVAYLKELVQLLASLSNPIERDIYAAKAAGEIGVDKTAILLEVQAKIKQRNKNAKAKDARNLKAFTPETDRMADTQRRQNLDGAVPEERLLILLLKYPDTFKTLENRLTEQDFCLPQNAQLYACLLQRLQAGHSVELMHLSAHISLEGMNKLSALLASDGAAAVHPQQLEDYIAAIQNRKARKNPQQVAVMEEDEWNSYTKHIMDSKR